MSKTHLNVLVILCYFYIVSHGLFILGKYHEKIRGKIHWRITFWHGAGVLKGGSRGPPGSQAGGGRGPRATCGSHPCGPPVRHLSTLPTPISSSSTKIIPIQRIFCEFLIQSRRCRGNQSGSLFGYSVGWGNHRRMHLHHHFRLHNDAWVVHPWTTGP